MKTYILNFVYQKYLKLKFNVKFGQGVKLSKQLTFGGYNYIGNHSEFYNSDLGKASYIGNHSSIRKTKIGKYCSIGDYVRTGLGVHPTENFVSSHPSFFSINPPVNLQYTDKQEFIEHKFIAPENRYYLIIGNDVWIGNNVLIMDGIRIGDGAVIGAGAIVTKDVPPYGVAMGIPARTVKYRFDPQTISDLKTIEWWNFPDEELHRAAPLFKDIKKFIHHYKTNLGKE